MTLILVIEREKNLSSSMRDLLEMCEYDVVTANRDSEALQYLTGDNPPPQVIIASNPDAEGLLREVRADLNLRQIPFMMLLSHRLREEAGQPAADALILPPFDAQEFLDTLQSLLKPPATTDESDGV